MLFRSHKIDVVAMVHHETSSGMLNPLEEVGALSKENGSMFIVDCVSSAGAEVIDMEKCHIAFFSSSSSKAICSYSGLSFVVGKTAEFEKLKDLPVKTMYLNLYKFYDFIKNISQTPNTPAVHLFYALEQALDNILQERCATKIATAHTADDQAETVVMWMLRGSGTGGLSGIPPKRGGIVRPFLTISRSEIETYLEQRQLSYRLDSSNGQSVYLRNRLRLDMMPHLKEYSPGIVNVLSRQAAIIHDDHAYLEHVAAEAFQKSCVTEDDKTIELDRPRLLALPVAIQRRVIRQSLQKMRGNAQSPRFDIIQQLLDRLQHGQSGWSLHINAIDIGQEYERLVFIKRETVDSKDMSPMPLRGIGVDIPGEVVWSLTGQRVTVSMKPAVEMTNQPHSSEMHLDADTFTPELRLRSWKIGRAHV